jgi:hypothetical protein
MNQLLTDLVKRFRELTGIPERLAEISQSIDQQTGAIREANERAHQQDNAQPPIQIRAELHTPERIERQRRTNDNRQYCLQILLTIGTWLAFLAAAVYAGIAAYQFGQMKVAAKAAKDAATTASDALTKVQRAFIFAESIRCDIVNIPNGGISGMTCVVNWKNSGNTPTKVLHLHTNIESFRKPLPDNFTFPDLWRKGDPHINKSVVIWPNSPSGSNVGGLTNAELLSWAKGHRYLYVWGWARYRDIFDKTPEHVTKFCSEALYDGEVDVPTNLGSTLHVVRPRWSTCDHNNCYDEQCSEK